MKRAVVVALTLAACKIELHADKDKAPENGTVSAVDAPPAASPAPAAAPARGGAPAAATTAAPPIANLAPAAPTTGFCPTAKKKPNACGWAEDGTACTACVTARCCEEGRACGRDCACVECSEAANPAACGAHLASFNGAVACLKAKCAAECGIANTPAAPAPQPRGNNCRATKCVEGAQGNALCQRAGCGVCYFGGCTVF